jgi:hypothetical protein
MWLNFSFDKESRGRCRLGSSYDVEGSSQYRATLQLLRQVHAPFYRPCASFDGLTAEVPSTEGSLSLVRLEAFATLKLWIISAPFLILPEVSSGAMFTVAAYDSIVGIAIVVLQD